MITPSTRMKEIKRSWHLVDAKGKILGRMSTQIAQLLMGKQKPYFVRHLDCGDHVVVINTKDIVTTGNKGAAKLYTSYSGYPGGLRQRTLRELMQSKPGDVLRHSVSGMLPKNKLRSSMIARLHLFTGPTHTHKNMVDINDDSVQKGTTHGT